MIASVPLVAGVLLLGWRSQPTVPADERAYVATTVAVSGGERAAALQLYAAGQFPGACERFSRAAARRLLEKIERERRVEAAFSRETTEHFVVKHRAAGGEAVRPVVQALERAWERVGDQLDYHPTERVTIVLYEGVQFHDVTRVHGWVTGLYDGKIRLPLGSGLPSGAALEQLVVHEYAHAAIHELSRGRTPRWLQEGLAQYLEGVRVDPLLRGPGGLTLGGLAALTGDPDPARARVGD